MYINLDDFINSHLDIKMLPFEIQKYRYEFYDNFRKKSIDQVKEERNKIILENNQSPSNSLKNSKSSGNFITIEYMREKLIEEEKKNIERIKQRGKKEIQFIIEQEIKIGLLKEKNEEKQRKIKEKEENNKIMLQKLLKENEEQRKLKEQKRINEYERITNEKLEKFKMKQEKEEKRYKELKEEERKRRELLKKREQDEFIRLSLHKSQIFEQLKNNEEELILKRLLQQKKDKEHIELLMKKRNEIRKKNELKKQRINQSMKLNKINIEKNLEKIKNDIENKEKEKAKRLEEFYKNREYKMQKQKELNTKRRNLILKSIKSLEELNEEKKQKFFEKMERIEQTIFLKEIQKNEETKSKKEQSRELQDKVLSNRNEIDKQLGIKKEELMNKFENIQKRVFNQKKNNEFESLKKLEEIKAKQEEKGSMFNRILKIKEYKSELKRKEIEKKEMEMEQFKIEKNKMTKTKKTLYEDILKEKQKILLKIDNLIRKKKKIDEEFIKEIFPDDEEIFKQLTTIRKSRSEHNILNNKISSTTTSRNVNLSYSNYYKDEIEKKVEEFSNRLRNDMNKAIEEEKINEEKRSKEYLNAKDAEKKRIEEKNAIERENANKRILQIKQNYDKTIKGYEEKLKRDYQIID